MVHAVTPFLHDAFGLVEHACASMHATQLPEPLQTRSGPHDEPAGMLLPSTHARAVQSVMPALHGALGLVVHAAPAVHMPQKPVPSHVEPPSHETPASLGAPSTH